MTRRTQSEPGVAPAPTTGPVLAPVSGSSALDTAAYGQSPQSFEAFVGRQMTAPPAETAKSRSTTTTTDVMEPRTARATLHPSLVTAIAPHSTVAERYRAIRTRLVMSEDAGPLR